MEILSNFGFEPILFFAQIVNFLIIFFVLKKFLYAPLLKTLEERKQKIAEGLQNAEDAARLVAETSRKEEEILKKAQQEAKKLIEEAKDKQAVIMKEAEETTQCRIEKMLQDAREQINLETVQAQKQLSSHVSRIAIQYLQEATAGLFGPEDQGVIVKNAISKLKKKAD